MRNLILAAGVAALAITAPAAAKPERDGGGKGRQAQVERGGKSSANRGGGERRAQRMERRGGGGERQVQRMERRGGDRQIQRMERRGGERQAQRMERRGGNERRFANLRNDRNERRAQRVERGGNERRFANLQRERNERRSERVERRGNERRIANVQRERSERRTERVQRRNDDRRVAAFQRDRNERRTERVERRNDDRRLAELRRNRTDRRDDRFENRSDRRFTLANQRDRQIFEARRDRVEQRNFWRDRNDGPQISWRDRDDRDGFRQVARWRDWNDGDWDRAYAYRGIPAAYVGCPPGLAKKSWGCVPPGRAREMFIGRALPTHYASNYFPVGLRDIYYDTDDYYYRYGDGYAYRVDRQNDLVLSLLPLIGAGFGVGQQFPYYQQSGYYVPASYQSFYPSYGDDYYRYANGYVYEIDGSSGYIEDVIPLLDRGYGLGQMMPAGYSYYNVPYQYRDYYYDTDDYYYRYAPGAIYQVDRDTQLITAIAALLTGGLSVGQPLPAGYSMYNVPYAYRDRYYDSPDAWYRYSNGYIYEVDPTTQLIRTMVQALV